MQRIRCTLAYEGTAYAGWQVQAYRDRPQPPTVQGMLEAAVARVAGIRRPVLGAGRTDAGVHADGQVCHFDVPARLAGVDWANVLNTMLPPDIRILDARRVPSSFHSRASACGKVYTYALWQGPSRPSPRVAPYVWRVPRLDTEAMREAAAVLVGRHDFSFLQNRGGETHSTEKQVRRIEESPGLVGPLRCPDAWPVCTWTVEGDGFLKQMVRNILGLLVWVGRGRLGPAGVVALLDAGCRGAVPSPTAPAQGLSLYRVIYPNEPRPEAAALHEPDR